MRTWAIRGMLFSALIAVAPAQTCLQIHGRAVWYRGDGFFAIWHIGTHHIFSPVDKESTDLVCRYFDCESGDRQPALFADFTICPAEPYVKGAAQTVTVTRVQNPRVVADWPAPDKPQQYVRQFYSWYARVAKNEGATGDWREALKSAHWDLTPELAKRLEEDSAAQAKCREINGIDFDPFLYTQEPAEKYEVGAVSRKGKSFFANVYSVRGNRRSDKPEVIAEFNRESDRWLFVNFYYPSSGTDLLTILKSPLPKCSAPR